MKVFEVLENDEFENHPINDKTYLKQVKKKQLSLQHQRTMIVQKILQHNLNYVEASFIDWDLKRRHIEDFPKSIRHHIVQLKKIDVKADELVKRYVSAKVNMKYAVHDAELALRHALGVRKGRYLEGEDAIASDPHTALAYATEIIRGKWPKGEAAIAKDPEANFKYHSFLRQYKMGLTSDEWDLAK